MIDAVGHLSEKGRKKGWNKCWKAEKIKGKLTELKGNTERYKVHNDNSSQHREEMVWHSQHETKVHIEFSLFDRPNLTNLSIQYENII